jgi:H+/gluconate symporter-like permease
LWVFNGGRVLKMGLLGILIGLILLIWFAFRGWSVLLLAPAAALVAALFGGEPLLASWTQIFMRSGAGFFAQFFPLFLLGAVFGKLMDDSGSVSAVADFMIRKLGDRRAMLAVVLAGALVTYGGVSLFVAFFVLAPMAQALFRAADIPRRLMPAAIVLGTSTFTMSAMPGTPSIQNAIPMPFFGTTPFAAPGIGIIHPPLCSASACGGLAGRRQRPADRGKATGQTTRPPPIRQAMSWFASGPPRRGNSTPQRLDVGATAKPLRQSSRPLRRWSWWSSSIS